MKESFLIYNSFYEPIKSLSDSDKGKLFSAIFEFNISGKEPDPSMSIYPFFLFFKNQLRLDKIKYEDVCKKNKTNVLKRWNTKDSIAYDRIPPNTTVTKHTEKEKEKEKEKENVNIKYKYNKFYDSEIEKSNHDENYLKFIMILFGANPLGKELISVLKMPEQLSWHQFPHLWKIKEQTGSKITETLLAMENWKDLHKRKTILETFRTFATPKKNA